MEAEIIPAIIPRWRAFVTLAALAGNKEPALPTLALSAAAQDMRCFVLGCYFFKSFIYLGWDACHSPSV